MQGLFKLQHKEVINMPKNRKHGEGSVSYDNTRQKWQVAFYGSDGKRHYKRFDDEGVANAYLIEQLNNINHGCFVAPSELTVGQWVIEWIETYKKNSVKRTTYEYYVYISKYIAPIGDIKLQDLQPYKIQKLYNGLLKRGLSKTTVHKVHAFLRSTYKTAYSMDMVQKDIMELIPAPKFEKKPVEIFDKEEIKSILETAKAKFPNRYPIVLLDVTTGMRMGEILGLRWCDVDLSKNEIFIRHTLSKSMLGKQLTTPKTKASIRKISIPLEMANVLRKLKNNVANMDIKQETFIFKTRNDTLIDRRTLERSWERILYNAKVPYRKFHALRHTHATTLLAEGIPIVEVSRRLGHSKIAHTLDLYGQSIKGYDEKISDKISKIYNL